MRLFGLSSPSGYGAVLALYGAAILCAATVTNSLPRGKRGAIYARFSTRYQQSLEDQIRVCRSWADANEIIVDDRHVFSDAEKSGRSFNRPGLKALLAALERGEIDVVIFHSTSRLTRKVSDGLRFVEQSIVDKSKRCVFVSQGIDSAKSDEWKTVTTMHAMHDEMMVKMTATQVRAAHEGLALSDRVWGTITFGYAGTTIEGRKTRQGRPAQTWGIEATAAKWVKQIFHWFVVEERSLNWIASELNRLGAPLPPRTDSGRWTRGAVRRVIRNKRYIGDFSYGWTEVRWQNKAGYARGIPRDEPRRRIQSDHLRIIDDALFFKAQEVLANRHSYGGRSKRTGVARDLHVASGLLFCPKHHRPLQIVNSKGAMRCPACQSDPEPALMSSALREVAERMICQRVASLILKDETLVSKAIEACRHRAEKLQTADGQPIQELEKQIRVLNDRIAFILDNPGDTDTDKKENSSRLVNLRGDRAKAEADLAKKKSETGQSFRVPTEAEVRQCTAKLSEILAAAADSTDHNEILSARRIIHTIAGGRILMSQQGERTPRKGWLRGMFKVNVLEHVLAQFGVSEPAGTPVEVTLDFRTPSRAEELADEVVELYEKKVLGKAITRELSQRHGEKISRGTVVKALKLGLAARGLPFKDGRSRRSELARKTVDPTLQEKLTSEVMEMYAKNALLVDIADKFKIDHSTVTAIVANWHRARNLPVPDGRSRRKTLAVKERPSSSSPDRAE